MSCVLKTTVASGLSDDTCRVPYDEGTDALPKELVTPIAVADNLYDQVTRPNLPSIPGSDDTAKLSAGEDKKALSDVRGFIAVLYFLFIEAYFS